MTAVDATWFPAYSLLFTHLDLNSQGCVVFQFSSPPLSLLPPLLSKTEPQRTTTTSSVDWERSCRVEKALYRSESEDGGRALLCDSRNDFNSSKWRLQPQDTTEFRSSPTGLRYTHSLSFFVCASFFWPIDHPRKSSDAIQWWRVYWTWRDLLLI